MIRSIPVDRFKNGISDKEGRGESRRVATDPCDS